MTCAQAKRRESNSVAADDRARTEADQRFAAPLEPVLHPKTYPSRSLVFFGFPHARIGAFKYRRWFIHTTSSNPQWDFKGIRCAIYGFNDGHRVTLPTSCLFNYVDAIVLLYGYLVDEQCPAIVIDNLDHKECDAGVVIIFELKCRKGGGYITQHGIRLALCLARSVPRENRRHHCNYEGHSGNPVVNVLDHQRRIPEAVGFSVVRRTMPRRVNPGPAGGATLSRRPF